jgi:beta-phosphoglucomutase-like phosphatase (HAD superfamily)
MNRVVPMVVTGSGQKTLLDRLNRNFPDIFKEELMVTAFDVKYGKPNPEPYLMGLAKAGVRAEEALVVENAPLGVESAHKAGIFTLAANTGPLPDKILFEAGADLVFSGMDQVGEYLRNLSSHPSAGKK